MLQKPNVLPLPCLLGEKPLYVNTKQFYRILKMRAKRAQKSFLALQSIHKGKYQYESRHKHAKNRQRNEKGRFLSKQEKTGSSVSEVNEKGNFEHEGNFKGRNVKKKDVAELFPLSYHQDSSDQQLYFNESPLFLNHQDGDFFQFDTDGLQNYFEEKDCPQEKSLVMEL